MFDMYVKEIRFVILKSPNNNQYSSNNNQYSHHNNQYSS